MGVVSRIGVAALLLARCCALSKLDVQHEVAAQQHSDAAGLTATGGMAAPRHKAVAASPAAAPAVSKAHHHGVGGNHQRTVSAAGKSGATARTAKAALFPAGRGARGGAGAAARAIGNRTEVAGNKGPSAVELFLNHTRGEGNGTNSTKNASHTYTRSASNATGLASLSHIHESIMICNIFVEAQLLISSADLPRNLTLAFKTCRAVDLSNSGESTELMFMAESKLVGSFVVTATPEEPGTMALAVFSTEEDPDAAEFQSHQFRAHEDTEVAIFASTAAAEAAAYTEKLAMKRFEDGANATNGHTSAAAMTIWSDDTFEELPLNAVVSMSPGDYTIKVGDHRRAFKTAPNASYVVIVVGDDPADEDVVIYTAASSAASRSDVVGFAVLLLCAVAQFAGQ